MLFAVFPVLIAIMLTLMAQTLNFKKLLLVDIISPLGLIGAGFGLLLFEVTFGFNACWGSSRSPAWTSELDDLARVDRAQDGEGKVGVGRGE